MPISPAPNSRSDPAPCRVARRLLAVATGAGLLIILAIGADLLLRDRQPSSDAWIWMQALSLTAPALRPAGSPGRHPETVHPAVDPRFTAGLENVP